MRIENLCVRRLIGDVAGATTHGHKMAVKGGYIYQTYIEQIEKLNCTTRLRHF